MKKITVFFILVLSLIIFNKTIISKIIIFTTSKLSDKNISIKNIDIDYLKKQLTLNSVEVKNTSKIYYENIFEAEKVKIKYNFKSLFTRCYRIGFKSLLNYSKL